EASLAALQAAAIIVTANPLLRVEAASARILRTSDGAFIPPEPGTVFIAPEDDTLTASVRLVDPHITASDEGKAALTALGIEQADASSELEALLTSKQPACMSDEDWQRFSHLAA